MGRTTSPGADAAARSAREAPAAGRDNAGDPHSPTGSHVYNLHEKSHGCATGPCTDMHSILRGFKKVFAKAAIAPGSLNSPLSRQVLLGRGRDLLQRPLSPI